MWAYEHYGITPDIMAVAKGIGGGFPLGACLATEEAAKGMVIGTHGSTYGGNPLAMAAGEAVLDVMQRAGLPRARHRRWATGCAPALEQMIPNHDHLFEEIRGKGLMLGIKMKEPAVSRDFVAHLRDNHGLLTVAAGENVVRVLPPLVIDEEPHRRMHRAAERGARRPSDDRLAGREAGAAEEGARVIPLRGCGAPPCGEDDAPLPQPVRRRAPTASPRCWPTRSTARRRAPAGPRARPMPTRRSPATCWR